MYDADEAEMNPLYYWDFDVPFMLTKDFEPVRVDAPGHPGDCESMVLESNGEFTGGDPMGWGMARIFGPDPILHPSVNTSPRTTEFLLENYGPGPYVMTAIEATCYECNDYGNDDCDVCMGDPAPAGWAIWVSHESEPYGN